MVVVITALAGLGLLLLLGYWRTRLRQRSYESVLWRAWTSLSPRRKYELLTSSAFVAGLKAQSEVFTRTLRLHRELRAPGESLPLDRLFSVYVRELRRTDPLATSHEWRGVISQIQRWVEGTATPRA